MFLLNDNAKNDPAVQIAIQNYRKQIRAEQFYRDAVRRGLMQPQPITVINISDRH